MISIAVSPTYIIETKTEYQNFSSYRNPKEHYESKYISGTAEISLNYLLDKNKIIYFSFEGYTGTSKGSSPGFLGGFAPRHNMNFLTNIGYKFKFN